MKLQEALLSRRTVYKYEEKPVPKALLEQAFEAARQAPCHKHTHPWRFYVLGAAAREKLLPLATQLAQKRAAGQDEAQMAKGVARAVSKLRDVPVLMAVTSARSPEDAFREKEDYAATTCAIHNWVLSLWGEGIGAQWSTGSITRHEETYALLNIDPTQEELVGFLKAGYPTKIPEPPKKPLENIRFFLD
jgi:nitroreductase